MKTKLKKLMEAYCNRQSLRMDQVHFLLGGNRMRETQSPEELEMDDDDIIECVLRQRSPCPPSDSEEEESEDEEVEEEESEGEEEERDDWSRWMIDSLG